MWSEFTPNGNALLMTPFCRIRALPEAAPGATAATTWVSLQLCTTPFIVPSHTWPPAPWAAPKPEPAMVTWVPGTPLGGMTEEIVAVLTVKGTALDQPPPCRTWAFPDVALEATVATTCVSLQLTGVPKVLPSHTVPVPCTAPKPEPEMVTCTPAAPDVGDTPVMVGGTVKFHPLEGSPPTVTTRLPEVAPDGTATRIVSALQLVGVAAVPLKATVLAPCAAPKLSPDMVTVVPTGPEDGNTLQMRGVSVKFHALLATPSTVTVTLTLLPLIQSGTCTVMLVVLQLLGVTPNPSRLTWLEPCAAPKPVPVIVRTVPTCPEVGERPVMASVGADGVTVNVTALLVPPLVVTRTFAAPSAALAAMVRVAVIWVTLATTTLLTPIPGLLTATVAPETKLAPVRVTGTLAPCTPVAGLRDVSVGAGGLTVNGNGLLATNPTVTTTLPVVAPLGTFTVMLLSPQVAAVPAAMPLNVTVLLPCIAPKLVPPIVTAVPATPEAGDKIVMLRSSAVPAKVEVCVPARSVVTDTVAFSIPGDCAVSGLNCTLRVQLPPGCRVVVPPVGPQVVSGPGAMA
jgi:hypothetical protein